MNKLKKELLNDKNTIKFLEQIAGPIAIDVVKIFKKEALSPEMISKKLDEKITNVRATLNSLHYRGIACYKKTKTNNNLYEFLWEIKFKKIIENIHIQEIKKYKKIEMDINSKSTHDYFVCPKKCIEVPFEIAAAYNFKCPNCDSSLEMVDIKKRLALQKRKLKTTKENIEKLEILLEKIKDDTKGYICE
ncbi:MAG: hypothetical protein PHR26_01000 [Candidatus ainarchaeum sp.]|nr:hypothetical protein [Candidatus ainarchaeum sp.]MDD3975856.1 hypothetical protein [Candidatus ainarchaeum sp.]